MLRLLILILALLIGWTIPTLTARGQSLTFGSWISSYPLVGPEAAPLADPDADGIPNLLEYAFADLCPITPNSQPTQHILWGRRILDSLPIHDPSAIQPVNPGGERRLTTPLTAPAYHVGLRWWPRPGITDILWEPQYSRADTGLQRWFSGEGAVIIVPQPDGSLIAWSLSLTPTQYLKRFFWRIRAHLIAE